ncbi:hypothetical protein QO002_006060 [Pararhizobium capsulatum DSM 1112]|uniref:Uncharacterized protein n=1 Tax=Pararhizobium capsulatum DSM 1112 TaxID=1121113 RepID=A0ABU0C003_9HYPH|nr:hypothetical protein [Pararhizobium capsulatum]MDQ0323853.1 hypothetical protein [Pararhizobium capsulatum DSM 1112]
MEETGYWLSMDKAPKDGSRILVTIRPSEQGPVLRASMAGVRFYAHIGPSPR